MKKIISAVLIGVLALTITLSAAPLSVTASSWHYGPLPAKLRHNWHAKAKYSKTFKIYRYTFKHSGEKTGHFDGWKYAGHGLYHVRDSQGFDMHIHYYNSHKITAWTFWHDYVR